MYDHPLKSVAIFEAEVCPGGYFEYFLLQLIFISETPITKAKGIIPRSELTSHFLKLALGFMPVIHGLLFRFCFV
ncbi:MAG: hypothetical protein A2031_10175 [Deltaproteobacteria bacterium RBG_19FT_COMBO_43_11]|nr:MAG: hypothetical protein A2031_10175 [Deltaproteobacteria bacterium RBG_19FT_COMBO_43_11]